LIYIEEKQIKQEDNSKNYQDDLSPFKIEKNRDSISPKNKIN